MKKLVLIGCLLLGACGEREPDRPVANSSQVLVREISPADYKSLAEKVAKWPELKPLATEAMNDGQINRAEQGRILVQYYELEQRRARQTFATELKG